MIANKSPIVHDRQFTLFIDYKFTGNGGRMSCWVDSFMSFLLVIKYDPQKHQLVLYIVLIFIGMF